MSYTKTQWNNDTAPAINETNLNKIEQGIYDNDSHIGDLTTLTTTAKTSTVNAVNEVNGNIGTLSNLTTTANTDLVSAINELDNLKATKDVATTSANGLMSASDKTKLDNGEVYSTAETRIGTWIDGKPLYRKVIVATNIATNTENSIAVSDASIISVKKIEGYYIGGGGGNIASSGTLLGADSDNTRSYVFYSPANGSLKSYCGVYNTGNGKYDTHIILEYTKTTD